MNGTSDQSWLYNAGERGGKFGECACVGRLFLPRLTGTGHVLDARLWRIRRASKLCASDSVAVWATVSDWLWWQTCSLCTLWQCKNVGTHYPWSLLALCVHVCEHTHCLEFVAPNSPHSAPQALGLDGRAGLGKPGLAGWTGRGLGVPINWTTHMFEFALIPDLGCVLLLSWGLSIVAKAALKVIVLELWHC